MNDIGSPMVDLHEVGEGVGIDAVQFLEWGSYQVDDVVRGGHGWTGGPRDDGTAFVRNAAMNITFCRNDGGTLTVRSSALGFTSYLDGLPSTANVFPIGGLTAERLEDILEHILRHGAGRTAAAHLLDGTRQHAWEWHKRLREAHADRAVPTAMRVRSPTRFFGINLLEITADSFSDHSQELIDAAKLIQGRGKKTACDTTAYITYDLKVYGKSGQMRREKNIVIPDNLLRFEQTVTSARTRTKPSMMQRLAARLPEATATTGVPIYLSHGNVIRCRLDLEVLRGFLVDELRAKEGKVVTMDDLSAKLRRAVRYVEHDDVGRILAWSRGLTGYKRRLVLRAMYWQRLGSLGMTSMADAIPALNG